MKVAVIGAGMSGLAAARELTIEGHQVIVYEKANQIGGTWLYTPETESEDPLGLDPNREIVHSSSYAALRTNLPRHLMGFPDYPFTIKKNGVLKNFPGHEEVLQFLKEFANEFKLGDLIRFDVEVVRVEQKDNAWWVVDSRSSDAGLRSEEMFEAVVVCNGHHSEPRSADVPGEKRCRCVHEGGAINIRSLVTMAKQNCTNYIEANTCVSQVNLIPWPVASGECALCGAELEDARHCLINCLIPKGVVERSSEARRWMGRRESNIHAWLLSVFEIEGMESFALFANLLWQIWKTRCRCVHEGGAINIRSLVTMAKQNCTNYIEANTCVSQVNLIPWPVAWQKPPVGYIKCNVDASVIHDRAGIGAVFRDANGICRCAACLFISSLHSVEMLELRAMLEELRIAFERGYSHVCLEGDSLLTYHRLLAQEEDLSVVGALVDDIHSLVLCFEDVQFKFVKRVGNVPAHLMSRIGTTCVSSMVWDHNFPTDVIQAVLADLI